MHKGPSFEGDKCCFCLPMVIIGISFVFCLHICLLNYMVVVNLETSSQYVYLQFNFDGAFWLAILYVLCKFFWAAEDTSFTSEANTDSVDNCRFSSGIRANDDVEVRTWGHMNCVVYSKIDLNCICQSCIPIFFNVALCLHLIDLRNPKSTDQKDRIT